MTVPELIALARKVLAFGVERIQSSKGDLQQEFFLVKRDGSMEIMLVGGDVTNSEMAKSVLARQIKARVRAGDVEGVIMLSDVFYAVGTPEMNAIRQRMGWTVLEAHQHGLCKAVEAVLVMLQSPMVNWQAIQEYTREGGRITLVGEPKIVDDIELKGRFAVDWGEPKSGGSGSGGKAQ